MNRSLLIVLTIIVTFYSCKRNQSDQSNGSLKVSSFNIRFNNPADGSNQWSYRKEGVINWLMAERMDVIGMQEVLHTQLIELKEALDGYNMIGVARDDGMSKGEYSSIFYRVDRFSLLDSGTFWLSETPEKPSVGWDAALPRVCSYVYLKDAYTDEVIHVYNTHFDHMGETAREESARLIINRINSRSSGKKVILLGDFNTEPNSIPYNQIITGQLIDSYNSNNKKGPSGTWNGFEMEGDYIYRIDYIFFKGFSPTSYVCVDTVINGLYLSDHFPVVTVLNFKMSN